MISTFVVRKRGLYRNCTTLRLANEISLKVSMTGSNDDCSHSSGISSSWDKKPVKEKA